MKALVLCSVVALAGIVSASAGYDFETFVREHNKKYASNIEESMRRAVFAQNQEYIEKFNRERAKEVGYELGISHLADLTPKEISVRRGLKVPSNLGSYKNSPEAERFFANLMANVSDDKIPDEVDWRKVPGRVTEVKDQGQCGSCWAFASTGALEGQMVKRAKGGKLISLSEQNLVDCSKNDGGCQGGYMGSAYADIQAEGGIESEADYPYTASDGAICMFNPAKAVFNDKSYFALTEGDEDLLKKTVATFGPVAVGIDSSSTDWIRYKSGIYTDDSCGNTPSSLDHGVLVVGYGTDKKQKIDYWIVKNSWGSRWGDHGYIKMARNKDNLCGIATAAIIPTF